MKLQSASKKEIKRVAAGAGICLVGMWGIFFALSCVHVAAFGLPVILGGLLGTGVAILNFIALCLTIQTAAGTENEKQRQAKLQLSYNARLIFQGVWVVAAFLIPWLNVAASAVPLMFPSLVILVIRNRDKKNGNEG